MGNNNVSNDSRYRDLVDMTTGEVIAVPTGYVDNQGDYSIIHKRQSIHQIKWRENGNNQFTFAIQDNVKELLVTEKVTLTSLGALLVLLPYLDTDGYLKKMSGAKDKPLLTREEIISLLKVSSENFKKILSCLKVSELLSVEGTKGNQIFKVNSRFHLRGKLPIGLDKIVRIQNRGIVTAFDGGNVKLDQLGFLYMLIPYLSYNNCRLVKDVNGSDDVENALSITELAENLGLTVKTVEKYLKFKIEYKFKDGLYKVPMAISFNAYGEKNKKSILVNPIFYRRNMDVTGEIMFNNLDIYFKNASKKVEK